MFEKLEAIERTYEELTQQMTDPAVIGDQTRYTKVAKQSRELEPVVEKFRELRKLDIDIAGAKELMRDAEDEEMREMAAAELPELEERRAGVEDELKVLLLPKDPKERDLRGSRRDGRRRGLSVRGGDIANVRAFRRETRMEVSGH
jgi:peptide chain release factor 1